MQTGVLERTTTVISYVPMRTHQVSDQCAMASLREDLHGICGRDWYAFVMLSSGHLLERGNADWGLRPDETKRDIMRRLAIRLNSEIANGGHWVVAWNMGENELSAIYRDRDGDMQFSIDFDEAWDKPAEGYIARFVQRCQEAFDQWFLIVFKEVDVRPEETIKRALGESSQTAH